MTSAFFDCLKKFFIGDVTEKLLLHYKSKHPDKEVPEALMATMGSMTQEELNVYLSNFSAADTDASGRDLESDQQDFDVSCHEAFQAILSEFQSNVQGS